MSMHQLNNCQTVIFLKFMYLVMQSCVCMYVPLNPFTPCENIL